MTNTMITKTVDGLNFILPASTKEGAEQARITLTDLAKALGYSNKHKLKELVDRHSKELAELDTTFTVQVVSELGVIPTVGMTVKCGLFDNSPTVGAMSRRGNGAVISSPTVGVLVHREGRGSVTVQEPTYNKTQALYLILRSETAAGRKFSVRFLKAYESLIAEVERGVAALEKTTKGRFEMGLLLSINDALNKVNDQMDELRLKQRQLDMDMGFWKEAALKVQEKPSEEMTALVAAARTVNFLGSIRKNASK